jgi:CBS domain-containing protein
MPIKNLARDDVVTASQQASVSELAQVMNDENVGSVVITNGDEPVGIVTDRDLTVRVLADDATPQNQTAGDVMSEGLYTVDPNAGFYEATELMSEHGVRRVPVCTEAGELTGIITADDLTELLADEQQQLAEVLRAQRPEY